MRRKAKEVLSKQKRLLAALSAALALIVGAVCYFVVDGPDYSRQNTAKIRKIDLPADKVDPQDIWMSQADTERKLLKQRLDQLEGLALESKKREEQAVKDKITLQKEVYQLREALEEAKQQPVQTADPFVYAQPPIDPYQEPIPPQILEVVMEEPSREKVRNVDQVIPAGTTVRALLVSSVDASCGIQASTDPHPVKLRLLDDGHLPKQVRAKLKGGILIASAYGDLSSERVYMRLERLTKTQPSGDFVETTVTGFVSGEDGKFGVRGVVVDRSDKLVRSAAISGFFGGISQFFQATTNAQDIRDATKGTPNALRWDIIKDSGLKGGATAMDKLSEYYIRRAEQLQPVIQVAAGRVVDITFTHGAELGDLYTQEKVRKIRSESKGA